MQPETHASAPAAGEARGLDLVLTISPCNQVWTLKGDPSGETLVFESCGQAEAAAGRIARRVSGLGVAVFIDTRDRDHDLVSRRRYGE